MIKMKFIMNIQNQKMDFTFVFVNALTGMYCVEWIIGDKINEKGNGYLVYNFRGQAKSKFEN